MGHKTGPGAKSSRVTGAVEKSTGPEQRGVLWDEEPGGRPAEGLPRAQQHRLRVGLGLYEETTWGVADISRAWLLAARVTCGKAPFPPGPVPMCKIKD